ncbi:hypothetical protein OSI78_22360, partial [Mycobacterium ulcerans]
MVDTHFSRHGAGAAAAGRLHLQPCHQVSDGLTTALRVRVMRARHIGAFFFRAAMTGGKVGCGRRGQPGRRGLGGLGPG